MSATNLNIPTAPGSRTVDHPTDIPSRPGGREGDLRACHIEAVLSDEECEWLQDLFIARERDARGRVEVDLGAIKPLSGVDLSRRIAGLIHMQNATDWRFDLGGLVDGTLPHATGRRMLLTMARPDGAHSEWHSDYTIKGSREARQPKLVAVIQLSRPSDYEGGDLEVYTGERVITGSKDRGDMVLFPAFFLHRRLPVTRGGRLALIALAYGQAFR